MQLSSSRMFSSRLRSCNTKVFSPLSVSWPTESATNRAQKQLVHLSSKVNTHKGKGMREILPHPAKVPSRGLRQRHSVHEEQTLLRRVVSKNFSATSVNIWKYAAALTTLRNRQCTVKPVRLTQCPEQKVWSSCAPLSFAIVESLANPASVGLSILSHDFAKFSQALEAWSSPHSLRSIWAWDDWCGPQPFGTNMQTGYFSGRFAVLSLQSSFSMWCPRSPARAAVRAPPCCPCWRRRGAAGFARCWSWRWAAPCSAAAATPPPRGSSDTRCAAASSRPASCCPRPHRRAAGSPLFLKQHVCFSLASNLSDYACTTCFDTRSVAHTKP